MKKNFEIYERNLALEAVRVTEAAALSASMWIGWEMKNLQTKLP